LHAGGPADVCRRHGGGLFSALLCIRWLIRYVSSHDFTWFAWYRIVFGAVVLLTAWGGWVTWAA
jgi:undecaprenyl-diphosphatase